MVLEAEGEEGGVVFGNGDILSDKFIIRNGVEGGKRWVGLRELLK